MGKIRTIGCLFSIALILLIPYASFAKMQESLEPQIKCANISDSNDIIISEKSQLSYAAFADTHIGAKYQYPFYGMADHLDFIGKDLVDNTNKLDFAVHLGDIVNHNTAHVNGVGLPWYVN